MSHREWVRDIHSAGSRSLGGCAGPLFVATAAAATDGSGRASEPLARAFLPRLNHGVRRLAYGWCGCGTSSRGGFLVNAGAGGQSSKDSRCRVEVRFECRYLLAAGPGSHPHGILCFRFFSFPVSTTFLGPFPLPRCLWPSTLSVALPLGVISAALLSSASIRRV